MGFVTGADAVRYAMGVVPMLAGLLLSRMYPNEIHKILFLCPMSEKDRKKYMITAYAVRIGISMMLYALFSLALLAAGVVSVLEMLEIGVLVLAFLMGANMHHALFSMQTARAEGDEYYWLSLGYGLLFMVSWVISGCAMASFSVRDGIFVQAGVLTERHLDMSAAVMILLVPSVARRPLRASSIWWRWTRISIMTIWARTCGWRRSPPTWWTLPMSTAKS